MIETHICAGLPISFIEVSLYDRVSYDFVRRLCPSFDATRFNVLAFYCDGVKYVTGSYTLAFVSKPELRESVGHDFVYQLNKIDPEHAKSRLLVAENFRRKVQREKLLATIKRER